MIRGFGAYGQEQTAPALPELSKPALPGYITTEEAKAAEDAATKKLYYAAGGAMFAGLVIGLLIGKAA